MERGRKRQRKGGREGRREGQKDGEKDREREGGSEIESVGGRRGKNYCSMFYYNVVYPPPFCALFCVFFT